PRGHSAELNGVLRALANGSLQVVALAGPGPGHRPPWIDTTLHNVAYLAVLGPDGRLLGSSDPAGAAFSPPERAEWGALAANALAGESDQDRLVAIRTGAGPAALGAYPIAGGDGRPVAAVLVAT